MPSSTPTRCDLPTLPPPIVWGGLPEKKGGGRQTGRTIVTQDGLAELGGYLAGVRQWIAAASACMEARQ
jgi:hypothetical protein